MDQQDKALDDLLHRVGPDPAAPAPSGDVPLDPGAPLQLDDKVYQRMVKPTCFAISVIVDWCNRRFVKKAFRPMSDDQIELVRDDMAAVLKRTFDAMLPELAKRNPEWICLAITFLGIYTANTEDLPKPEPVQEPVKPAAAPVIPPAVSSVEVVR